MEKVSFPLLSHSHPLSPKLFGLGEGCLYGESAELKGLSVYLSYLFFAGMILQSGSSRMPTSGPEYSYTARKRTFSVPLFMVEW